MALMATKQSKNLPPLTLGGSAFYYENGQKTPHIRLKFSPFAVIDAWQMQ